MDDTAKSFRADVSRGVTDSGWEALRFTKRLFWLGIMRKEHHNHAAPIDSLPAMAAIIVMAAVSPNVDLDSTKLKKEIGGERPRRLPSKKCC